MTAKPAASNPNMEHGEGMSHWTCAIRCNGRRMIVRFSMGSAHIVPPTVSDVLDCLASDGSGLYNGETFEQWCAEYGYDTDSRKALRTYTATTRQTESLARVLGHDAYETLLFNVERM